jgi:hypothetical protein
MTLPYRPMPLLQLKPNNKEILELAASEIEDHGLKRNDVVSNPD